MKLKLISSLLLGLAATTAFAHKDHDHGDAPVIKPQQVEPKAPVAPTTPAKPADKAVKEAESKILTTPAEPPAKK